MFVKCTKFYSMSTNSCNHGEDKLPKTVVFGGRVRDRNSSQAMKRPMRADFLDCPEDTDKGCLNSVWWNRKIAEDVAQKLGIDFTMILAEVNQIFEAISLPVREEKKEAASKTPAVEQADEEEEEEAKGSILLRLSPNECKWLVGKAIEYHKLDDKAKANMLKDKEKKKLVSDFLAVYEKSRSPEIAAFGRFLASKDLTAFKVDAAFSFSHAIGTSESNPEVEDFVAVDDISDGSGAGHMGHDIVSASTMFFEGSGNVEVLLHNLKGDKVLTLQTIGRVLRAFAYTVPKGKQHSMLSKPLPDFVLFEVLDTEFTLADAFIAPVQPKVDLAVESVQRFLLVRNRKHNAFDIKVHAEAMVSGVDHEAVNAPLPEHCRIKDAVSLDQAIKKVLAHVDSAINKKEKSK
jgi:CRISPR system Cascade subunit CasC